MIINDARNPQWVDDLRMAINVEVDFDDLDYDYAPYTVTADDETEHGKQLYSDLIAGNYGIIAEPTPKTLEELQNGLIAKVSEIRAELNEKGVIFDRMQYLLDQASRDRLRGAIYDAEESGGDLVEYERLPSEWVTLTIESAKNLRSRLAQQATQITSAQRTHDLAIRELKTTEEAKAYDVTSGWPT